MRNVNAKIGYILNNIRWDKYDQKTINSVGPDLYDIVVEYALLGVRGTVFKASILDQNDTNLNRNDEKY
jgi:hypothetical protein